ncbi:hypothetical protein ACFLZK_02530 [Patescibacteria group bacterium]
MERKPVPQEDIDAFNRAQEKVVKEDEDRKNEADTEGKKVEQADISKEKLNKLAERLKNL